MKTSKLLKGFCICLAFIFTGIWIFAFYAETKIPDRFNVSTDNPLKLSVPLTIKYDTEKIKAASYSEHENDYYKCKAKVSLLNIVPLKESVVTVSKRKYVVPSGEVYGIKLYSDGVIIVKTDNVQTQNGSINPGAKAGLSTGDVIISINSKKVKSSADVSNSFLKSNGDSLKIIYMRKGTMRSARLVPVKSINDGKYKAGLWIRDSSAGIGTMTFYDAESGNFAALGHAICDADTKGIINISGGELMEAQVTGCYKGKQGHPGELCGVFENTKAGDLYSNNSVGIYGRLDKINNERKRIAVAVGYEIREGSAKIISEVDESGPQYYDIEIVKINANSEDKEKNMIIKVTDKKLLSLTGGIVQGMSGSPIIQGGKLVGAVTHVLVNDPTKGYAIFAETMLTMTKEISDKKLNKAS